MFGAPRDAVRILAVMGPSDERSDNMDFWANVRIEKVGRTYDNATVSINGVELAFKYYKLDPSNGYYSGTLSGMSVGDSVTLELDFPLIGTVERTLSIPTDIPEISVTPALPPAGTPIASNGPSSYDVTLQSPRTGENDPVAFADAYDDQKSFVHTYSSTFDQDTIRFINGPILDVNGRCFPYLLFGAQYWVGVSIPDWHPESAFFVYGPMAPWITNLD